jgi:hypothetical protein
MAVMQSVLATPDAARATRARAAGVLPVALYQAGTSEVPGLGARLTQTVQKLPRQPSARAWDFLSIALAVYAADRFALRRDFADGWTRVIDLKVEVVDPSPWTAQAGQIAAALRFLTGDIWRLAFLPGGQPCPVFQGDLTDRDCACLFSGGMDSLLGAMELLQAGRRPYLVSQASPKEGQYQTYLAHQLALEDQRFEGKAIEKGVPAYEPSSRARSILFFGYGALAACGLGGDLYVPENGLISVNPPLTRRRIGSLSTRTTHPYFMEALQRIFVGADLRVRIINPFQFKTKGEMLRECRHPLIGRLAKSSYSCGKGKRLNMHCGRCVPCLIRRASFKYASMQDTTGYAASDLRIHENATHDDVLAARQAVAHLRSKDLGRWAAESGPLPNDPVQRAGLISVVERGLLELKALLDGLRLR